MRTDSALVLNVRELLEHPGVRKTITFDEPVPDLRAGLTSVPGDLHFDLTLEAIDGGLLVRGKVSGEHLAECRRCLKTTSTAFTFEGSEVYRPATDVWEEGYMIKDLTVDLEPMVKDTVMLNLPISPLCRPDCEGLCPQCGKDRNEGGCDCAEETWDPRWSALRELGKDLPGGSGVSPDRPGGSGVSPDRPGGSGVSPDRSG